MGFLVAALPLIMNDKKNCFSYWFPILEENKIPVPKTKWVDMDEKIGGVSDALRKMFWMLDLTDDESGSLNNFVSALKHMTLGFSYPLFLRTGQTSHKHSWNETCFVEDENSLIKNAQALAEYSFMADMEKGLPVNVWVVRELLKTAPAFTAFGGMPITKEFRYFIKDHEIVHSQPYWPFNALDGHVKNDENWKMKLESMNILRKEEKKEVEDIVLRVAEIFDGYWSVDLLKDEYGNWYVTDMATGEDSYIYGEK